MTTPEPANEGTCARCCEPRSAYVHPTRLLGLGQHFFEPKLIKCDFEDDPSGYAKANVMDAPDGPRCTCGKPSAVEDGTCTECMEKWAHDLAADLVKAGEIETAGMLEPKAELPPGYWKDQFVRALQEIHLRIAERDAARATAKEQSKVAVELFDGLKDAQRQIVEMTNRAKGAEAGEKNALRDKETMFDALEGWKKRAETAEARILGFVALLLDANGALADQLAEVTEKYDSLCMERDEHEAESLATLTELERLRAEFLEAEKREAELRSQMDAEVEKLHAENDRRLRCMAFECQAYLRRTREKDAGPLCYWCGHARSTHDADGRAVRGPAGDHAFASTFTKVTTSSLAPADAPRTHVFGGPNNTCLGCGKASGADDDHEQECPAHGDPVPPIAAKDAGLCAKCRLPREALPHARGSHGTVVHHDFEPRAADVSAVPPGGEKDAGLCTVPGCGLRKSDVRHDPMWVGQYHRFAPLAADAPDSFDVTNVALGGRDVLEPVAPAETAKVLPAWRYDVTGREIRVGDEVSSERCARAAGRVTAIDEVIHIGAMRWSNDVDAGATHLRIVDPPVETAALDEFSDAHCDDLAMGFSTPREREALVAIKRRNARIAELEEQRRLSSEGERRMEAALATAQERARHLKDELRDLNRRDGERLAEYQCQIQELEAKLAAEKAKIAALEAAIFESLAAGQQLEKTETEHLRHLRDRCFRQRRELRRLNRQQLEVRGEISRLRHAYSASEIRVDTLQSALANEKGKEEPAEAYRRGYRKGWVTCRIGTVKFNDTYSPPEPHSKGET